MLVLGACKGYLTEKVRTLIPNLNTVLVIILGGMTYQLQVLIMLVTELSDTDHTACVGNGCYLGAAHLEQQGT